MRVLEIGSGPLLDRVRRLEGKDRAGRRQAVLDLLGELGLSPVREPYHAWGGAGENILVEFGQGEKLLLISAHYDAVKGSPGANDNASGVSVLLEVCRRLGGYRPRNRLRAIFFDGEEPWLRLGPLRWGCVGSRAYLRAHGLDRTVALYNLEFCGLGDMVGIWPAGEGDRDISALNSLQQVLKGQGVPYALARVPAILFSGDHRPFRQQGLRGALTLSLVPREEEVLLRSFARSPWSAFRLWAARRRGGEGRVPLLFQRLHTPEDKAEYLREDSLALMAEVLYRAVVALDTAEAI